MREYETETEICVYVNLDHFFTLRLFSACVHALIRLLFHFSRFDSFRFASYFCNILSVASNEWPRLHLWNESLEITVSLEIKPIIVRLWLRKTNTVTWSFHKSHGFDDWTIENVSDDESYYYSWLKLTIITSHKLFGEVRKCVCEDGVYFNLKHPKIDVLRDHPYVIRYISSISSLLISVSQYFSDLEIRISSVNNRLIKIINTLFYRLSSCDVSLMCLRFSSRVYPIYQTKQYQA